MKKLVIVDDSRTAIETLALNEACLEAVADGQRLGSGPIPLIEFSCQHPPEIDKHQTDKYK